MRDSMTDKKRPVGRPKWEATEKELAQVEALAATLNQDQIADFFGIADRTLRARMHSDPRFAAAYHRGKAQCINQVAESLVQKARGGDTRAQEFYLATQARWSKTKEVQHTVPDSVLDDEARSARLAKILGAAKERAEE